MFLTESALYKKIIRDLFWIFLGLFGIVLVLSLSVSAIILVVFLVTGGFCL